MPPASPVVPPTPPSPPGIAPHPASSSAPAAPRLLRIHEVAAALGLTTRAIRYWEEVGLLSPAARSDASYRLYDEQDVERLRFIRSLREETGFSLAEIGQLLEDEEAGAARRAAYVATDDPAERRRLAVAAIQAADRQLATLRAKVARLESMVGDVETRRRRLTAKLAELDAGEAAR